MGSFSLFSPLFPQFSNKADIFSVVDLLKYIYTISTFYIFHKIKKINNDDDSMVPFSAMIRNQQFAYSTLSCKKKKGLIYFFFDLRREMRNIMKFHLNLYCMCTCRLHRDISFYVARRRLSFSLNDFHLNDQFIYDHSSDSPEF